MTIETFMRNFGIKNESKVISWIEKGFMPGVYWDKKKKEWYFPELSRPPYTERRAKKTTSIYKSIVVACVNRKGVSAKLYDMSDKEFDIYVNDLVKGGFLYVEVEAGNKFYFATLKSTDFLKRDDGLVLLCKCVGAFVAGLLK